MPRIAYSAKARDFLSHFFIVFVFGNFEKSLDGDRKKKSKIKEIAIKYTFS